MPDWRMNGPYFKSCNCEPGCPCDFLSPPTYQECEGVLGMRVDEGEFDGVSLDGIKWAVAYHWPGPLHEGHRRVLVLSCRTHREMRAVRYGRVAA